MYDTKNFIHTIDAPRRQPKKEDKLMHSIWKLCLFNAFLVLVHLIVSLIN